MPRFAHAFALVLLLAAASAEAQAVRGDVRDEAGGRGLQGAVVTLVDAAGAVVAATVTDRDGAFRLASALPGTFVLRAERVGFRIPDVSVTLPVASVADRVGLIAVRDPLVLDPVRVVGRSRCTIRPADGEATAALWSRARRALEGTALLQERELVEYEVRTWIRDVSFPRGTARVRSSETRVARGRPFATRPAAELVAHGLARIEGDRVVHHGPDAALLLSDAFLDAYCFRAGPRRGALVGLAFEPVRRDVVGIEGVLWLDGRSGELRHLEYGYTHLPGSDPGRRATGRIEFRHLPGGGWIVDRWWIRRPARTGTLPGESIPQAFVEAGGEVRRVRWVGGGDGP
jgi:hypothetical protein